MLKIFVSLKRYEQINNQSKASDTVKMLVCDDAEIKEHDQFQ
jgi:hypothetical protein